MNTNIDTLINETLNSIDNTERANPKPFLLTRLHAKMANDGQLVIWDKILKFISKPAVAFGILFVIIAVNATVFFNIESNKKNAILDEQQFTSAEDFNSSVATLNDFENTEQQ